MRRLLSAQQFFQHQTFADAEQERVATLLFSLLRLFLVAILGVSLLLWIVEPTVSFQLMLLNAYLLLIGLLFIWLYQGHFWRACCWFIGSLWVLISIFVIGFEGVQSPAFYSYVVVIVLAGLLLSKRVETIVLVLSVLMGAAGFFVEQYQLLPIPMYGSTLVASWLGGTTSVILLSVMVQWATHGWRMAAKQARAQAEQNAQLRAQAECQAVALQEANQQLQELDHLKTKFVRDMTHELRTPLTNLKLYLDLWELAPPEKKGSYLETLKRQNERLVYLMDAVSRVARLDAGVGFDAKCLLDLNAFIPRVVDAYQPKMAAKGMAFVLDLAAALPAVWGVSDMLLEVVEHLVANAVLYSPTGSITVRTFLSEAGLVCLSVSDEGIGIAAREQRRVFDRFYRADNIGELAIAGAGLGLTIVERIVALHEGVVQVESELGRGSTFTVCLPVAAQTADF